MLKYVANITGCFLAAGLMAGQAFASDDSGLTRPDLYSSYLDHSDLKGNFCLIHKDIDYGGIDLMTESKPQVLIQADGTTATYPVCAESEDPQSEETAKVIPDLRPH